MKALKAQLRKKIRETVARLSNEEKMERSRSMLLQLESHGRFHTANTLLLYYSLPDEVNTHAFIERWATQKRILLPVIKGEELELRIFTNMKNMAIEKTFHIAEPQGHVFTAYHEIDLAIVPGMAFDIHGHRMGRGKGYYDRLLPQLPCTYRIGLCFPEQLLPEIPYEAHDCLMDEVIPHITTQP